MTLQQAINKSLGENKWKCMFKQLMHFNLRKNTVLSNILQIERIMHSICELIVLTFTDKSWADYYLNK